MRRKYQAKTYIFDVSQCEEASAVSFFDGTTYSAKVLAQMQKGAGEFHPFLRWSQPSKTPDMSVLLSEAIERRISF